MKTRPPRLAAPILLAAITACLVPATTLAQRPIPQGMFACHVMTENRRPGVILVQAESVEDASRGALSGEAWETPDVVGAVVSVIECVAQPTERFQDRDMEALLNALSL